MNVNEILKIFAQYGFRKASMEDLARAAEMSRQGLYKRFGSKEGVFEWAVETHLTRTLDEVRGVLASGNEDSKQVLLDAFHVWTGRYVVMLRTTPHGMEMMDRAIEAMLRSHGDIEAEFHEALAIYCHDKALAKTRDDAQNMIFALAMASKGLLLKSQTEEVFMQGLERVLVALLPKIST